MLRTKKIETCGCTFLGKGIVGRPEMGVVAEAKMVTFDEWDFIDLNWKGEEVTRTMYWTDNDYAFDDTMLRPDGPFEIELYAPNWR